MTVAARPATRAPTLRLVRGPRLWLLLLPGLACGALGLLFLDEKSVWLDESVSATLVQLDWATLTDVLVGREANMALYHLLLKGWTAAFGAGEFAIRSLSVLCAAGAAYAVSALSARMLGSRTGFVSGMLFAANPVVLVFAQTARGYALCLLLAVVAELLFLHAVHDGARTAWLGYAVVAALAACANLMVLLLPMANAVAAAALPRPVARRRDLALSTVLVLVLVAPLLVLARRANVGGVGWISGTAAGQLVERLNAVVPAPVTLALGGAAVLGAGVATLRRLRPAAPGTHRFVVLLLGSWLLVPVLGIVALSIGYRPLLVPRYLVYCLPPLVILAAAAIVRLRPRGLALAGVVAALSVSLALDVIWYRSPPREDWRSAVATVTSRQDVGDGVLFSPAFARMPFDYYRARGPRPAELEVVGPPGPGDGRLRALGHVPVDRAAIAAAAGRVDRLWLVARRDGAGGTPSEQEVRTGLEDAGLRVAGQWCFRQACVAEYLRPTTPTTRRMRRGRGWPGR
jgi:mannosyltransferase